MSDIDEVKAEWFEFGRKSGRVEEQARIIKLLKKELKNTRPGIGQSGVMKGLQIAIALIKGEQE